MTVMQVKSLFHVPTIDIGPYKSDPESINGRQVIDQVREACMTTGFFEMVGHGVPAGLQKQVFQAAKALFSLPGEEKKKMDRKLLGGLSNRGYEVMGTQALQKGAGTDQKEGFYVSQDFPQDHPKVKIHPTFIGPNVWPSTSLVPNSIFKDPIEIYYVQMMDLCNVILEILAAGLPYGPHIFDDFMANDPLAALRLLHYPPTGANCIGAGAHTDFGAFTLLLQDEHAGLQVQDPVTGTWVPIAPHRGAYVVNIGDMMQRWTRGLYKSNLHRVINGGAEDRYSMPFFFDGNLDCKLVPFDGEENEDGVVLTVEEHMKERFSTTYG